MFKLIIMYIYSSNVESNAKKIPWYQIVNAVVPVSYTHLDVYKRQLEYGAHGLHRGHGGGA